MCSVEKVALMPCDEVTIVGSSYKNVWLMLCLYT
jgi:hypothetical protein